MDVDETSRERAFCAHTIALADPLVVLDATIDPRFAHLPNVTGERGIRFYAGTALRAPSGHAIGSLCIADHKVRAAFSDEDRQTLQDLAALVMDKLAVRRLELARKASQNRFESIAATSPDAIAITRDGRITFWNKGAERLFGYTAGEVIGRNSVFLHPEAVLQRQPDINIQLASQITGQTAEVQLQRRDGGSVLVEVSVSTWSENGQRYVGSILRDVSERRVNELKLKRLAEIDPLTELPNRTVLRAQVARALSEVDATAVMMLDLDGFKDVNDMLGHWVGDAVLRITAQRLLACARPGDTVARLGGDEFGLVFPGVTDPAKAAAIAERLVRALSEPFIVDDQPISLSASVGIALYPDHARQGDELLTCADTALYQVKSEGRHGHRLFLPAMRQSAKERQGYRQDFRRSVDDGDFELFYQPQIRLSDRSLVGAEALLRWRHPRLGLLTPDTFLPALEQSRHAAEVGNWVIGAACRQAAAWRGQATEPFRIGVNLFSAQFREGDLARRVQTALDEAALPATALELEITENIIIRHDAALVRPLETVRALGVGVAFDDYGTGYASLSLLKRFPLTRLKIDRSFVHGMKPSVHDAALVDAILFLGRSFGLHVIAEGIETEAQATALHDKGCAEGQGYLFGKPMPAAAFAAAFGLSDKAQATAAGSGAWGPPEAPRHEKARRWLQRGSEREGTCAPAMDPVGTVRRKNVGV
jgi:diguanylate cyclase (GGDEF)-like protein/PAS domain S-box-containing protein